MDTKFWETMAKNITTICPNATQYEVGLLNGLSANYDFQKMAERKTTDNQPQPPAQKTA